MQKISIDSVIFCENSKYTFGLCNLYTFKRVLASSNVCPFLSAKFLQLQDVFPKKKWRTVLCRWFMWGWGSLSPICDCATIVDFRSQSGENGSPSSASLSPWKHKSFLSQNPPADMHTHIFAYTLTTAHHMLTLLSTDLGFVWAPPRVRLGRKCVSFSPLFCHKQMRCGVGRQCSLERLFIGNSYPQRQKARESNHNNNSTDNGNNVD